MTGVMTDEPVFRVRLTAPTVDDLRAFTDEVQPDLGCRAIARRAAGVMVLDVLLSDSQLQAARSRAVGPVALEVLADETANGRLRQREVGSGDRYAARGEVPRGLGSKE
jgi:hypothetical protein